MALPPWVVFEVAGACCRLDGGTPGALGDAPGKRWEGF